MSDQLDRREAVLDALFAVLNRLPGVDLTDRNRVTPIPEGTRVALVLMDGIEEAEENQPSRARAVMITSRPSLWLYVAASQSAVSDRVAHWRRTLIAAVRADATLGAAVTSAGKVSYAGAIYTYARGERVEAAAEFRFALTFPDTLMEI